MVAKSDFNTKGKEIANKTINTTGLVTKTNFEVIETEHKIPDDATFIKTEYILVLHDFVQRFTNETKFNFLSSKFKQRKTKETHNFQHKNEKLS